MNYAKVYPTLKEAHEEIRTLRQYKAIAASVKTVESLTKQIAELTCDNDKLTKQLMAYDKRIGELTDIIASIDEPIPYTVAGQEVRYPE